MSSGQGNSPVNNLTYDLIMSLGSKLEAINVYQQYLKDAQGDEQCTQLFQQLMQDDRRHAEMLQKELARHMAGK